MRLGILLLAVVLPVAAQEPEPKFRFNAPIEVTSKGPMQRVELPIEVYREAKRDLGDVRVLNGRGEPVPIGYAGAPDSVRPAGAWVDLPIFPVSSLEPSAASASKGGTEVTIRTADGTLVEVRGHGAAAQARAKPTAYLLDASALKDDPIRALVFEWDATPGSQIVKVRIESSEDLKAWSTLGSGPLVRVEGDGRVLSQPRVDFTARKVKYLRITWAAPGFALKRVRAEKEPAAEAAPRFTRTVQGTPGAKPGEFLYDLGARVPVEAYRLVPADENDVISAQVTARSDEKEAWRAVGWAPFYRLRQEDGEKQSPPIEIGRLPSRYWMVRVGPGAAPKAPALEVRWRPAQVVFVARGDAPFRLAFGDAQAPAVALPVPAMIPNYTRLAELALPLSKVGAVESGPPPTRWAQWWREASPRRMALWAILILGVAVLGFMAWRLLRAAPK